MIKLAHELEFISQINRDGLAVTPVAESYLKAMHENKFMKDEQFMLIHLSLSQGTFIACGFNCFVVKLKI